MDGLDILVIASGLNQDSFFRQMEISESMWGDLPYPIGLLDAYEDFGFLGSWSTARYFGHVESKIVDRGLKLTAVKNSRNNRILTPDGRFHPTDREFRDEAFTANIYMYSWKGKYYVRGRGTAPFHFNDFCTNMVDIGGYRIHKLNWLDRFIPYYQCQVEQTQESLVIMPTISMMSSHFLVSAHLGEDEKGVVKPNSYHLIDAGSLVDKGRFGSDWILEMFGDDESNKPSVN